METAIFVLAIWAAPALCASPGDGVVVHLKDGSSLTGALVMQDKKKLRLDIGGAVRSFPMDAVKVVEPKTNDVQQFRDMLKSSGGDRRKLLVTAQFARAKGLDTMYDQLVQRLGIPNQNDVDDAKDGAAGPDKGRDEKRKPRHEQSDRDRPGREPGDRPDEKDAPDQPDQPAKKTR